MGLSSFIKKGVKSLIGGPLGVKGLIKGPLGVFDEGIGLDNVDKAFRTGRTSAINAAKDVGATQIGLSQELLEQLQPALNQGIGALGSFGEAVDNIVPVDINDSFAEAQASPILDALQSNKKRELDQYLASKGLRRSGAGAEMQSNVLNDALLGLTQQIFNEQVRSNNQGLQARLNEADLGLGQAGSAAGAIGGIGQGGQIQAQALADQASKKESLLGNVISLGGTALGALSDKRMKENITLVGKMNNGLNLYKYNYKGDDRMFYGAMAQEVQEAYPGAVIKRDGVLYVNYGAI